MAGEPVVPVTESGDAVALCQIGLGLPHFTHSQIVEAEVGRKVRLNVTSKQRPCLGDIRPFGEARSPPLVVLWNRMELREIVGEYLHGPSCYPGSKSAYRVA